MNEPLRIVYVEDARLDRELVVRALSGEGLNCESVYAATEKEFREALDNFPCDLILSDFTLPSFSGNAALALAKTARPEVPFLFVSGTIGEERAVESLRAGATDYVLKDNLHRLGPTVRRALREAQERAERLRAEQLLRASVFVTADNITVCCFMAKILVVDDEPSVRSALEMLLKSGGHKITLAVDGRDAIRQYRSEPADLVIIDMFMPEQDGIETIGQLKKMTPEIPIIAMTGNPMGDTLKIAQRLGVVAVFEKPFVSAEMFNAVQKALKL